MALGIADDDDEEEDSGREGDLVEDRDDDDDDDNQGDEGDGEPIDEDSPPEGPGSSACPPAVQLLLDIVDRCCHFLPLSSDRGDDGGDDGDGGGGDASVQVIIIDTLSACFMRLCSYSSHFLPCVHRVWPSLVARLVEMRATLLSHLLLLSVAIEEERGDHHHHHHHNNDRPLHHQISGPGGASIEIAAPLAQMMMHTSTDSNIKQQLPHPRRPDHHHPHHHHQHQHLPVLLPLLLDLMSILSITASSFMTSRFKDDLLPEILIALCAFQQQYVHTYHHSLRSNSTSYNHSKHSLVTKIKTALLRMLLQLTKTHQAGRINPMQSTLEPIASTLVWFIVPCIAGHEVGR